VHCTKDALSFQTVFESWRDILSENYSFHEIGDGMHEGMFVADDVARRPPVLHVGMRWLRHDDVAEALPIFRVSRVVKFQQIHFFEIEE
jgi:hypothetical protein